MAELLLLLSSSLHAVRRRSLAARVERRCSPRTIACASIESAVAALLPALDAERGDEIVMSGLAHAPVVAAVRERGLEVRVVDVDPSSLAPDASALQAALSARTRAVLLSHPFGGRLDLAEVVEVTRPHAIPLVIDASRSLASRGDRLEDHADVTIHSMGLLSSATACGGALLHVRSDRVGARVRALQAAWPVQRRSSQARSILAAWRQDGNVQPEMTSDFHVQPSAPLLWGMHRRLTTFSEGRIACRSIIGRRIGRSGPALLHVGANADDHTHWMVPLASFKPESLRAMLHEHGFGTASMSDVGIVALPDAPRAATLMDQVVLVPAYPELGSAEARRLERLLRSWREFDVADLTTLRLSAAREGGATRGELEPAGVASGRS